MKHQILTWMCIGSIVTSSIFFAKVERVHAFFGEDIPVLLELLAKSIQQIQSLKAIIGTTRETASVLEEMNRGVKEVLRLAETAHIPLPKQVYSQAKQIEDAVREARRLYGKISGSAPDFTRAHYQSGVEGLYLSEDAFEYSTLLDEQGRRVKDAALLANQSSAVKLSAGTLGVILHAISHGNRLEAKNLELASTKKIEEAAKENAKIESFQETHKAIEKGMKASGFSSLNSFGDGF